MTVVATKITGVPDVVHGSERCHTRRLTFSGNYATGGEAVAATAATATTNFGLRRITRLILHNGVAASADVATSNGVAYNSATGKIVFYESAATGLAHLEKTNSEAYPTGSFLDVTAFGSR
jgi:hypothetical protein